MKTAEPMAIRATKANRNILAIIATPSSQELRQLSNTHRDPPRFIGREMQYHRATKRAPSSDTGLGVGRSLLP
jgi:hypothetical protein